MSSFPPFIETAGTRSIRLAGSWQVQPFPLDSSFHPPLLISDWLDIPDCIHLQKALHPDQPYWGSAIRSINQQAWIYRRTFATPEGAIGRVRLRFEAVDYFAEVWLNDQRIGQHEGNFNPFEFDITSFLNREPHADNTLIVCVTSPWDSPNSSGSYPTDHVLRGLVKGLYEHGEGVIPPDVNPIGIWRSVWLLVDQGISIDHMRIRTELSGRVDVRLTMNNATAIPWSGSLALHIRAHNHTGEGIDHTLPVTLAPGIQSVDCTLHIPTVHWWWCWDQGAPDLYNLRASLLDDRNQAVSARTETFGVRTIRLERSPERFTYYLNDRPLFIRGSSYVPALYLSDANEHLLAQDIDLARHAHLNLLRVHVHVAPPELYDQCDAAGMLIWQDFELSWIHDDSPEFERRARALQREMIDQLGNHPSVITWACHNEPTMLFTQRQNLERSPDPALYSDAQAQDPTRPVFLCSGQMDGDWRRAGDSHSYYGAIWSRRYTDVLSHRQRLNTEFGFEAPAALETLRQYGEVWDRLSHLEGQAEVLWAYQAALIQTHVEHFRRLRAETCAGYIHFWLVDLVPQVGCGVLDSCRIPKGDARGGYEALRRASQPLLPILEHNSRRPIALWIANDTPEVYSGAIFCIQVTDSNGQMRINEQLPVTIAANTSQRIAPIRWSISAGDCAHINLRVVTDSGETLSENVYDHPFMPLLRPRGYPWKFDPFLGTKVFDRPGAPSLTDLQANPLVKRVPLSVRESVAEWVLRQHWPSGIVSLIAKGIDAVTH